MHKKYGFTLIELLIVLAVVGILASIALPVYHSYVARAQTTEALELLGSLKMRVLENYHTDGKCLSNISGNAKTGMPTPAEINGRYVASVTVQPLNGYCSLSAKFRDKNVATVLQRRILIMRVYDPLSAPTAWDCLSEDIEPKYLPPICRPQKHL